MMSSNFDFAIPQRQSLIGVLVLFGNALRKSFNLVWPLIVFLIFKSDGKDDFQVYLYFVGLFVLITIISFLRYWFFKFYIDYKLKEFVIENGIFNKTKTTIPFHKIQKVTIDQSLIQRIFNVYKLELDTAGSDKKEASIKAISQEMALELKRSLLVKDKEAVVLFETDFVEKKQNSFIEISLLSLLKIGVTANYLTSLAYLLLFFSTIHEKLKGIGREDIIDSNISKLEKLPVSNLFIGLLLFLITTVLIINLVVTLVKYFNFHITKDGNSFLLKYGLLNIKNTIINPEKVQILKVSQNYFQKKLNVNTIEIFQASSDENRAKAKDRTKIPGCTKYEKEQIIKLIINSLPVTNVTLYPNIRKLIIGCIFSIVLPVSIGILLNYFTNRFTIDIVVWIGIVYSFLMGLILFFSYRNYRMFISDKFIVRQSGAWDIDQKIIEPYKIQAIKTQQFFWQKMTNIGSVVLYTAGGRISFSTTNYTVIKEQVNKWLFQVEISKKHWM